MTVMLVLGVESSCDETGLALYDTGRGLLAHVVHSQVDLHEAYGGVVPELASRDHIRRVVPLLRRLLEQAGVGLEQIDAIAYTAGPGLAGALLVGAGFAESLALALKVPALPVHHLEGHLLSPLLSADPPRFPFVALLVSGGHTQLMRVSGVGQYDLLGETLDDAAGEAFDKSAKVLGLPYPGGPVIDRLAPNGNPQAFPFGEIKTKNGAPGFSFSGYKTAVRQHMEKAGIARLQSPEETPPPVMIDLIASFRYAVVRELCRSTRHAIDTERPRSLVLAGGVAANQLLRLEIAKLAAERGLALSIPPFKYCTDNAAMIATAGRPALLRGENHLAQLDANAGLTLGGVEAQRTSRRHL